MTISAPAAPFSNGITTRASGAGANIARIHIDTSPRSRDQRALPAFTTVFRVSNATKPTSLPGPASRPRSAFASSRDRRRAARSTSTESSVFDQLVTVIDRLNTTRSALCSTTSQAPSWSARGVCQASNVNGEPGGK
ncbi:MAG: hypothetical protein KF894_15955 [Labilithrix sp.]|nr:hypothetical protein [Labilithrix sp.]